MDLHAANEDAPKKIHVPIGDKIAYVEIISLKEQIYSVEFPGTEPIFITRIKDKSQQICWISIPQGNNDLAASVGSVIEKQLHGEVKREK
jgi:hypothetical protein